jgi:hypothetical protein
MIIGVYVGLATVGVFIYWFVMYSDANDGHQLVSWEQLRLWNKCDANALKDPNSVFYKFAVGNSGGSMLGANPCKCVGDWCCAPAISPSSPPPSLPLSCHATP